MNKKLDDAGMEKSAKLARQVAGTMDIEGMNLTKKEFKVIEQCATGKKSSTAAIEDLIKKYKMK